MTYEGDAWRLAVLILRTHPDIDAHLQFIHVGYTCTTISWSWDTRYWLVKCPVCWLTTQTIVPSFLLVTSSKPSILRIHQLVGQQLVSISKRHPPNSSQNAQCLIIDPNLEVPFSQSQFAMPGLRSIPPREWPWRVPVRSTIGDFRRWQAFHRCNDRGKRKMKRCRWKSYDRW